MSSRRAKVPQSQYGKYADEYEESGIQSDEEGETRRSNARKTRDKTESDDDEEYNSSNTCTQRSRRNDDDEMEEEPRQRQSNRKEKENKSSKTRRRTDEDNVSDDESSRRPRRSERTRRDEEDEDEDEDEERDTRRPRRNRRLSDEEEDVDERSSRIIRNNRIRNLSDEEEENNTSTRRGRNRNDDYEEEEIDDSQESRPQESESDKEISEEEPQSRRGRSRKAESDEDLSEGEQRNRSRKPRKENKDDMDPEETRKPTPTQKTTGKAEAQREDDEGDGVENQDDLMNGWKNRPKFEKLEKEKDQEIKKSEKESPFTKYDKKEIDTPQLREASIDKEQEELKAIQADHERDELLTDDKRDKKPIKKKNPFLKHVNSRDNSIDDAKPKKKEAPFGKGSLKSVGKLGNRSKFGSFDKNKEKKDSINKENVDLDDVLNVIDWKLGGGESFEGVDTVPEVEDITYKSKLNKQGSERRKSIDKGKDEELENINGKEEEDKAETKAGPPAVNGEPILENGHSPEADPPTVNGEPIAEKNHAPEEETKEEYKHEERVTGAELEDSLNLLKRLQDAPNLSKSGVVNSLMDTYLNKDYLAGHSKPETLEKPNLRKPSNDLEKMDELEKNLKNIREKNKKQPPPPVRNKPPPGSRSWEDLREQQRQNTKEKQWPPKEPPKDIGAYVVESYGQTDPYSKRLIKDIQRSKREEEERRSAEKRAEVVSENTKPVSILRSTFTSKPPKPRPGVQKPDAYIAEERSWIRHERKPVTFDIPPDEPDWMKLIRNRRWNSTVKARFPCKTSDKTDFERRSTTPKNWKRLATDKNALRMLSEIVGIGAEGEELFMRLANQRQKIEDEQEALDRLAEQELMAYEVARETLGEDVAYSLQMDNPLPAARMKPLQPTSTMREGSLSGSTESLNMSSNASSAYPFTTSQLEAAYITNQLLRLHPEEFKKLMSLERSRQATLRWQFSADPFDSVHEHQSLPFEIALLASEEPRVQQAMKKILARAQGDDYRSVFSTPISHQRLSRTRSEGYGKHYYAGSESDFDGYESSNSVNSTSSAGPRTRGRPKKKKKPVPPPPRPRGRSCSPSMMGRRQDSSENYASGPSLTVPHVNGTNARRQPDDDSEVHAHGLLTDEELTLSEEIAKLQELTSNIGRDITDELKDIEVSLEDRKKGFFEEAIRNETFEKNRDYNDAIDASEIASRRQSFIAKDQQSRVGTNVRDELPKARHKVRRINSSAALDAVFRRRRQMSESDMKNDDDDQANQDESQGTATEDTTKQMSNLVQDITNTFGAEKQH